jgi:hypothetical protein
MAKHQSLLDNDDEDGDRDDDDDAEPVATPQKLRGPASPAPRRPHVPRKADGTVSQKIRMHC